MSVPAHLGIIPDGNRRWAKSHGLPTLEGHRRGLAVAIDIADAAFDRGVHYLTIWAFSAENWRRPQAEVTYLMSLFHGFLTNELKRLEDRGVRLRFLGRRDHLSAKLLKVIDDSEARTANNSKGVVSLCLNYGGQAEIVDAVKSAITDGLSPSEITPELLTSYMYAPDVPPVDLIIRTSGEQRTSGFMMWRAAYAEYFFSDKMWPEFTTGDLVKALDDFAQRARRYGK
jgi:undecaprenyl diphosphate synthase